MATLRQVQKPRNDKDLRIAKLLGLPVDSIVMGSMRYHGLRIPHTISYTLSYIGEWGEWVNEEVEHFLDEQDAEAVYAILREPPPRPDWKTYFLGLAKASSARADCTRRRVGAVLVGPDNRVLSVGYNGAPAGQPGCLSDGACPRGRMTYQDQPEHGSYDNCVAIHAEANALLYAGTAARGATMYITDDPCPDCAKLLEAAGVVRVHTPTSTTTKETR